jgi:choline-sulfatase
MPDELLFDLVADPYEQTNRVEKEPETAGRLARLMGDWWSDNAVDAGQDPLLTVCREGGGYYVRAARDTYIKRLRETGRDAAADEVARRRIAPVRDPFDLARI